MIEFFLFAIFLELAIGVVGALWLLRQVVDYLAEVLILMRFSDELPEEDEDDQSCHPRHL